MLVSIFSEYQSLRRRIYVDRFNDFPRYFCWIDFGLVSAAFQQMSNIPGWSLVIGHQRLPLQLANSGTLCTLGVSVKSRVSSYRLFSPYRALRSERESSSQAVQATLSPLSSNSSVNRRPKPHPISVITHVRAIRFLLDWRGFIHMSIMRPFSVGKNRGKVHWLFLLG